MGVISFPPSFNITVNFPCGVSFDNINDVWNSHCPELEITAQGANETEAKEAIRSAIHVYLSCAREINLALAKPIKVNLWEEDGLWHASGAGVSCSVNADTENNAKIGFKKLFVDMIKSQTERAYGPVPRLKELSPKFQFKKTLSMGSVS